MADAFRSLPGPLPAVAPWPPAGGLLRLSWRRLDWWGAGIALTLQTGVLFPLLMQGQDGFLTEAAKAQLRLVALPAYLFTLLLAFRWRAQVWRALRLNLLLVALIALPFLSTLWSISPAISLRRAIGLALSMLLGYVIAVRFTPRQLLVLLGAVFGLCMALSLAMAGGMPGLGFMPGESAMRGAFIHKNQLGGAACISTLAGLGLLRDPDPRLKRAGRILLPLSFACLALSQSMTSLLAAVIGAALFAFYGLLARSGRLARIVLALVAIQLVAAFALWLDLYLVPFLEALGKDATLTGRVPLWAEVDLNIARQPWTGYGYEAFWTNGNVEAWRIWTKLGWAAPHAHNGWRQVLLGVGAPGAALLAATLVRAIRQGGVLLCAAPQAGWIWLNALVGASLTINLTECSMLVQNDVLWMLVTAAIAMFSVQRPAVPAPVPAPPLPAAPDDPAPAEGARRPAS